MQEQEKEKAGNAGAGRAGAGRECRRRKCRSRQEVQTKEGSTGAGRKCRVRKEVQEQQEVQKKAGSVGARKCRGRKCRGRQEVQEQAGSAGADRKCRSRKSRVRCPLGAPSIKGAGLVWLNTPGYHSLMGRFHDYVLKDHSGSSVGWRPPSLSAVTPSIRLPLVAFPFSVSLSPFTYLKFLEFPPQ